MGTRVNVIFAHTLPDFKDREEILRRLHLADAAATAVADYWESAGQSGERQSWQFYHHPPKCYEHLVELHGPGSLFVDISCSVVKLHTGGRWRGFLSMPELRATHLAAFRAIGQAFGAIVMVLYPDCDEVDEVFYENGSLHDCIARMQEVFGNPQPSIECIPHSVVLETEHTVPWVWYIDSLDGSYFAQFVPGILPE